MADTLEATVVVNLTASYLLGLSNSGGNMGGDVGDVFRNAFTDGTTIGKADKCWASVGRTLSGTTPEDIDVYDFGSLDIGAGAGKDPLGQSLTLAEITTIIVYNYATSTGNLKVGGKGTAVAWQSPFVADDDAQVLVPVDGIFALSTAANPAYAVADSSNHLLTMTPTDDLTYDIYLLGRSA